MNIKKILRKILAKLFPNLWYFRIYKKALQKAGGYTTKEKDKIFAEMLLTTQDKECMQIGVRRKKFGNNWVSVDLYDKSDYIDYNYDIHDLKFENNKFEVVTCNAVLEHVPEPIKAIGELYRVLKPGGLIWVEIPFNQPYHPSPKDYWRVSLMGMRVWMKDFEEIKAGYFAQTTSPIHNGVYFYGRKKRKN